MKEQRPITLPSTGRAADAAYLAAADVAAIATQMQAEYRLIGGLAVTLLTVVHGVDHLVPGRETADADFGADHQVIGDPGLSIALTERGYERAAGNRFRRIRTAGTDTDPAEPLELVVDVLAPSYEGRLRTNRPYGTLVVDEIPGLAVALARTGLEITAKVQLTDRSELTSDLVIPDAVSALILKAYAYRDRLSDRDAVDIWRLLEAAHAAGVTAETWPRGAAATTAAAVLHQFFGRPGAPGLQRLGGQALDRTRVVALVARLVR